jgi:hypothetical protein
MDLGFSTHGVHLDQRLVFLNTTVASDKLSATVVAPPNAGVYPPGNGYLFVVTDGGTSLASFCASVKSKIVAHSPAQFPVLARRS